MKNLAFYTLISLNAVLLALFVARMSKPNVAAAQVGEGRIGDYIMIPGSVTGGVNDLVYVLDQTSHQLGAISYDDSTHTVVTMKPPRDLDRDFDGMGMSGRRR